MKQINSEGLEERAGRRRMGLDRLVIKATVEERTESTPK
jgi:hypothetical protein